MWWPGGSDYGYDRGRGNRGADRGRWRGDRGDVALTVEGPMAEVTAAVGAASLSRPVLPLLSLPSLGLFPARLRPSDDPMTALAWLNISKAKAKLSSPGFWKGITTAQVPKATHNVDDGVKGVADKVVGVDDRVADIDDKVASVDDKVAAAIDGAHTYCVNHQKCLTFVT
jgi:hypothetical protein